MGSPYVRPRQKSLLHHDHTRMRLRHLTINFVPRTMTHNMRCYRMKTGAGDGNRTRIASLEGWHSTIELLPHAAQPVTTITNLHHIDRTRGQPAGREAEPAEGRFTDRVVGQQTQRRPFSIVHDLGAGTVQETHERLPDVGVGRKLTEEHPANAPFGDIMGEARPGGETAEGKKREQLVGVRTGPHRNDGDAKRGSRVRLEGHQRPPDALGDGKLQVIPRTDVCTEQYGTAPPVLDVHEVPAGLVCRALPRTPEAPLTSPGVIRLRRMRAHLRLDPPPALAPHTRLQLKQPGSGGDAQDSCSMPKTGIA